MFTHDTCFSFTPVDFIKHKLTHLEESAAFVLYYNELFWHMKEIISNKHIIITRIGCGGFFLIHF